MKLTCCRVEARDLVKTEGSGPRGSTEPEPGSLGPEQPQQQPPVKGLEIE